MQPQLEKIRKPHNASFRAFVRQERQFPFEWHYHPEFELTLITSGRGRRFVGDHIADFREGDLVLLGPLLPHTWRSGPSSPGSNPRRAIVIQFLDNFLGTAIGECKELSLVQQLLTRSRHGLQFLGRHRTVVANQLENLVNLRPAQKLSELLNILDELSAAKQTRSLASKAYAIPRQRNTSPRISDILETIHRNFQRPLRQNDLARTADLSRAAFNRNFRQATGTTLVDYVNDLRIGHACRMLAESSKPITEICFESGFTNLSNFNRCFLRRRGMPPSKFRSQFRR